METKSLKVPTDLHTKLKIEASSNMEKLGELVERRLRKAEKREANKRPTHNDKTPPWRPVYNSASGPAKSSRERPYRGKSERRQVIAGRRKAKRKAAK